MSIERLYKPCHWKHLLGTEKFKTAQVAQFATAPLSPRWASVVALDTVVEVQGSRPATPSAEIEYWVATVVDVKGYFVKFRYLGYGEW